MDFTDVWYGDGHVIRHQTHAHTRLMAPASCKRQAPFRSHGDPACHRGHPKVSLWLGHATLASTEMYLHANPAENPDILKATAPPTFFPGLKRPLTGPNRYRKFARQIRACAPLKLLSPAVPEESACHHLQSGLRLHAEMPLPASARLAHPRIPYLIHPVRAVGTRRPYCPILSLYAPNKPVNVTEPSVARPPSVPATEPGLPSASPLPKN